MINEAPGSDRADIPVRKRATDLGTASGSEFDATRGENHGVE